MPGSNNWHSDTTADGDVKCNSEPVDKTTPTRW